MTEQLVRDAMVSDPLALDASASAQGAAEALSRPDVRAVFVTDDGRLTGVITRKTLLEENDYERVPVVEDGRLVGVLSRSAVQRRLAEDEPPDPEAG